MAGAKSGKVEEAPGVARRREQIARVFAYVADVTYVGRAALLALGALVLLGATALTTRAQRGRCAHSPAQ